MVVSVTSVLHLVAPRQKLNMLVNDYKYSAQVGHEFYAFLERKEYLQFGSVIPVQIIHESLGIVYPETGTREDFKTLELYELNVTDHIRRLLLKRGMYLEKSGSAYRILLPSENANKVAKMMNAADRKLRRASTLLKNTPVEAASGSPDNTAIRIAAKRDSISEAQKQAGLLK